MTTESHIAATARPNASSNSIGALRYLLALFIILHHTNGIMGVDIPLLLHADTVVYAFFALSGYFAWQSYSRSSSARSFVRHRLLRLLPAYWAVVGASALGLSFVSDCSWTAYFTSPDFWKYLGANGLLMNFLAPELPGVFSHHLLTAVNGSLWYVKLEVLFTFEVPLFSWVAGQITPLLRPFRPGQTAGWSASWRRLVPLLGWLAVSAAVFAARFLLPGGGGLLFRYLCDFLLFVSGLMMSRSGLTACAPSAFLKNSVFSLILLGIFVGGRDSMESAYGYFLLSALLIWSLIRVFLSTGFASFLNRNNMTYSMYLCHFPLIQLSLCFTDSPWTAFAVALLLLALCTPLLFYGIERRAFSGRR